MISNYRFYRNAQAVLIEGYYCSWALLTRAQYKHEIFRFIGADCDVLVVPGKYVNELRALPDTVASLTVAHAHNLMGGPTNMNITPEHNLHFRTLQLKLTPNFGS